MKRRIPAPLVPFAAAGMLVGVLVSTLRSETRSTWPSSLFTEIEQLTHLEPVRVLPHVEMSLVALEARTTLDAGRPWAAWRMLQPHLEGPEAVASHVLLAARAAAGWGAWDHVREVLEGREWLARAEGGEGLFLLARALEELGEAQTAADAYARYAELPNARSGGQALVRLGAALAERGDRAAAARAYDRAAAALPDIADWLRTLQIEQLAAAGDPLSVTLASASAPVTAPVRLRRVEAEVGVRTRSGDLPGALRKLEWEERVLRAQHADAEATRLLLARGKLLLSAGRGEEARPVLRTAAQDERALPASRAEAADALSEIPGNGAAEELARAAAYEAAAKPGVAARALRAAIAAGAGDAATLKLRLAHLLYTERDYPAARTAFQAAAEELMEPELAAEATLYAARSLYRTGARSRSAAVAEFRRVAERYAGTAAAGSALFLLGDEAATLRDALSFYRRSAAVTHSPDAREALYRVGDRSLKLDDPAGAIRAWEEYVQRYPTGEATVRVAYETGKLHEKAGRRERAREMYRAAIAADPVSYYALRAGNRLGTHPIDGVLMEPKPWVGLASDPGAARAVLRRLDALKDAGMTAEWEQELASAQRQLDQRPAALLVLAEGLRDRNHPVEAIRLGRQLLEKRGGEWDPRLLRVVFPFPYRSLIEAEAQRAGVDPMLLAGLIRQESTFRPAIRSWVGATGLSQIMPATGRWLAPSVGINGFEQRLLAVPEVNLRMGARYLRDQLRSYDGAHDLALAAYNAGPGRATRWKRTLGYGGDTDTFREAIPFDETREYVKVVLRNAAIYERLYSGDRPVGLVRRPDR